MPATIIVDSSPNNTLASKTVSTSNFNVSLSDAAYTVKRLKFKKIVMKASWYPIDSSNNVGSLTDANGTFSFTVIPTGFTGAALASSLQTALNTIGGDVNTYTVTYTSAGTNQFKYTITGSTGNFTINWLTMGNSMYKVFGFNRANTVSVANTITSQNVGYALLYDYLILASNALSRNSSDVELSFYKPYTESVDTKLVPNPFFITIPIVVNLGDTIVWTNHDFEKIVEFPGGRNLSVIDVKIIEPITYNILNLNGGTVMLELEAELH